MNVNHFTQRYIDWVIKLGRLKFSLLGFLIVATFALLTHIVLSFVVMGRINWESLSYAIIFGLISAPFVIYFFTLLVDRLERSRLALAKSIQDKSALLASISHELRTPLNGILGLSQMLLDTSLTEQQRNYLHTISLSAVSLGNIFNDIIDLEKIDSHNIELYQRETDFYAFLNDIQNIATLLASQKGLSFEMKCDENLPHFLRLDQTRLNQILWNLLSNAVKFTEQGTISLAVNALPDNHYQFSVTDTGQGMPSQELDKIFTMYYQVASSGKRSAGSGIGLAISKNLAHLMQGDLTVTSELGQGTTFTLGIQAESVEPKASPMVKSAVQNLHILLVEDIQLNITVAKTLLEKLGHQVDVAMSGKDAIHAFEQNSYDLLLLDIQLPDMTGFDIAHYLRDGYENDRYDYLPPLVALTANVMQNKAEYQRQGMDDVLRKPLLVNELTACLNTYFGESEMLAHAPKHAEAQPIPEDLAEYFNPDILAELLEFIGKDLYIENIRLFKQEINGGDLDVVSAYQDYQQGHISKQQFTETAHKLKGAAASLAMQSVQNLANLMQQGELEEWEEHIEHWIVEVEQQIKESLDLIEKWLASLYSE
ncbi:ATP-binding protein [Lonepinella sp. BR2474]|uniref:ATP-binding protein n=1 Tax=Lonepinella sp. BR2474 TaxID=3434548 RepID=UPI003F6DB9B8